MIKLIFFSWFLISLRSSFGSWSINSRYEKIIISTGTGKHNMVIFVKVLWSRQNSVTSDNGNSLKMPFAEIYSLYCVVYCTGSGPAAQWSVWPMPRPDLGKSDGLPGSDGSRRQGPPTPSAHHTYTPHLREHSRGRQPVRQGRQLC
jgi:hypothetical protein